MIYRSLLYLCLLSFAAIALAGAFAERTFADGKDEKHDHKHDSGDGAAHIHASVPSDVTAHR